MKLKIQEKIMRYIPVDLIFADIKKIYMYLDFCNYF